TAACSRSAASTPTRPTRGRKRMTRPRRSSTQPPTTAAARGRVWTAFPLAISATTRWNCWPAGRALPAAGRVPGGAASHFRGDSQTYFFDPSQPAGKQWSFAANKITRSNSFGTSYYDSSDEESWVKLGDGSILTYDIWASADLNKFYAERFIPAGTAAAKKLG